MDQPSRTRALAASARRVQRLAAVDDELTAAGKDGHGVDELLDAARQALPTEVADQIERWPSVVESYSGDEQVVTIRGKELHTKLTKESLSGNKIPRVALPKHTDHGDLVTFWRSENLPGFFPYTAGVFPFKRESEDPARMFAGEGDPFRTNRRFKLLSQGQPATRLSTAFDSVTLYGRDPGERPDIYGKVGTSGVSVATLDDMKELYSGFDLVSPTTSVSMTINGPAPTVLAFFLNTAIDQQVDAFREREGREPSGAVPEEYLPVSRPKASGEYASRDTCSRNSVSSSALGITTTSRPRASDERRAWHAGVSSWQGQRDINSRSIGIEIMNNGKTRFTDQQIGSVLATKAAALGLRVLAVLILIGVFLLLQLAPGDTVDALMAQMGGGDAATAEALRKFYGLDLSVPAQLGNYLWHLVRLDLGFSSIYGKPVATVILERLPPTILLMTASLSFAFFFGLVFGVIASRGVNRWPDTLISTLGLIFYATPSFWFGLMAIVVFSVYLQWLPPGGFEDIGDNRRLFGVGIGRHEELAYRRHRIVVAHGPFLSSITHRCYRLGQ